MNKVSTSIYPQCGILENLLSNLTLNPLVASILNTYIWFLGIEFFSFHLLHMHVLWFL